MKSEKIIKNAKGITLIALVVTIVVLLILAAISIGMLTGENGIINQANEAKDSTEISEEKEKVEISSVSAAGKDEWGNITKDNLKEELDKNIGEGKYTLDGEGPFTVTYVDSNRSYIVNTEGNVYESLKGDIYDADVSEEDIAPVDIFNYEIISDAETGATSLDSLPTKEARITGIKLEYCNLGGYNPDTGIKEYTDTNYEIVLKDGSKITDTLVVPYQVEIDGEMYKITEADISMRWYNPTHEYNGYRLPSVKNIIYPNTIEKVNILHTRFIGYNKIIEKIILPRKLKEIDDYAFSGCKSLKNIEIPNSVISIGKDAFLSCINLTTVNYTGTIEQWNKISIDDWNTDLTNAQIVCTDGTINQ